MTDPEFPDISGNGKGVVDTANFLTNYVRARDLADVNIGFGADMSYYELHPGRSRTMREKSRDVISLFDVIPRAEVEGIQLGLSTYDITEDWLAALEYLESPTSFDFARNAGTLILPQGIYHVTSPLIVDNPRVAGLRIEGHGAVIKPAGAATSAIKVGGSAAGAVSRIKFLNILIDVRSNATIDQAVYMAGGSAMVTWDDLAVIFNNVCKADMACARMTQYTEADNGTAHFWTKFNRMYTRTSSGINCIGIDMIGAQNSTRVTDCEFQNLTTAIQLSSVGTNPAMSNGVVIARNAIEACTTGIKTNNSNPALTLSGLIVYGNRLEGLTTFVDFTSLTASAAVVPWLAGNYMVSSVTNYVVNPNNIEFNSLDFSVTPATATPQFYSRGVRMKGVSGNHALILDTNGTVGLSFVNGANNNGNIRNRAGGGITIDGGTAQAVEFKDINGISSSNNFAKNFDGVAAFVASATAVVAFANAEPNTSYMVIPAPNSNNKFWVADGDKTVNGFTMTCDAAITGNVRFIIVRYG